MNISVCITVKDEEGSIGPLLESLLNQTKKAGEIIVVDGKSSDRTVEIIKHYQKRDGRIKLLIDNSTRAKGRNLSIEASSNEIIAITDAGCVPKKDWLENITRPFSFERVEIVAGFYDMVGSTPLQKAMRVFLGTLPSNFNYSFLPSTRSMAFRKSAWEKIGGFPEKETNSAEDTELNYFALKLGMKYAWAKDARVEWRMPNDLHEFFLKVRNYALWDARSKKFVFPKKGLKSHNIKALLILSRYIAGMILLALSTVNTSLLPILLILVLIYFVFAYKKAKFWGIVLQLTSDFAVMSGFLTGILGR